MPRGERIEDQQSITTLSKLLASISDPKEMESFLRVLLTPAELHEVPQRLRIMRRLLEKVPQRRIAQEIQGSLCKVTRGSKMLKKYPKLSEALQEFFEKN